MFFVFYVDCIPFDDCKLVAARRSDPSSYAEQNAAQNDCQLKLIGILIDTVRDLRDEVKELRYHQNEQPSIMYTWFLSSFFTFCTTVTVVIWLIRTLDYNLRLLSIQYHRMRMMVSSIQHLKRCNLPSMEQAVEHRILLSAPRLSPILPCVRERVIVSDD